MQQWFDFKTVGCSRKEKKKQNFSLNWKKKFWDLLRSFYHPMTGLTQLSPWIRVICSISISSLRFWDQERKWRSFFKLEKEKKKTTLQTLHPFIVKGGYVPWFYFTQRKRLKTFRKLAWKSPKLIDHHNHSTERENPKSSKLEEPLNIGRATEHQRIHSGKEPHKCPGC